MPLNPSALERYGGMLAATHFYFEMTEVDGRLFSREELLSRARLPRGGWERLTYARVMLGAAIAQQAMLAGHHLLPIAYRAMTAENADTWFCGTWTGSELLAQPSDFCSGDRGQAALEEAKPFEALRQQLLGAVAQKIKLLKPKVTVIPGLIHQSAPFAANLGLYAVSRGMEVTGRKIYSYGVTRESRASSKLLADVVGTTLPLQYRSKDHDGGDVPPNWYFVYNRALLPLPSSAELAQRDLLIFPPLAGLFRTRLRVAEEMAGYDLILGAGRLGDEEIDDAKTLMAAGLSPFRPSLAD